MERRPMRLQSESGLSGNGFRRAWPTRPTIVYKFWQGLDTPLWPLVMVEIGLDRRPHLVGYSPGAHATATW